MLAPREGIEPPTKRSTIARSAAELPWNGSESRDRTCDIRINSATLCHLSYLGMGTASSGGRVRTPSIGHQKSAFCLLNYSRMILLRGYDGDRTRNLRGHNPALLPNKLHTQLLPHGSNAELLVQSQTGCQLHQGGMIFSCQVGKAGFEPTIRPAPKAGGRPNCPTSRSLRTASRVERNRTSVVSLPKGVPYHPAPTRWSPQRDSHPHDLSVTAV